MDMAKFLNTLFGCLTIFLLCFLWIVYCTKNSALSFGLSLIVTLCAGYIIFRAQTSLNNRKRIKRDEAKKIAALAEHLRYGADNGALFENMLRYYRFEIIQRDGDELTVSKNGTKSFVALRFAADSITREELAKTVVAAKRADCRKLYLFAHKLDKSLLTSASEHLPIAFADVANVYALLVQSDKLPEISCKKRHPMSHFMPKIAFNRRRFGWYIAMTLFMLAISVVSYIKWYTLAWATVSLTLAIYCLVNRRYNYTPTSVTLD